MASVEDRFWAKVLRSGPVPADREDLGPCWTWLSEISKHGYGRFFIVATRAERRRIQAHRMAYLLERGDIPDGLEPDHLCRNRGCVNPWHLELVTRRENTLRGVGPSALNAKKTHCKLGHPFDARGSKGERCCSICSRKYHARWMREHYHPKRASA